MLGTSAQSGLCFTHEKNIKAKANIELDIEDVKNMIIESLHKKYGLVWTLGSNNITFKYEDSKVVGAVVTMVT